jgi:hypothetical protein
VPVCDHSGTVIRAKSPLTPISLGTSRIAFTGVATFSGSLLQSLRKIISANDGGDPDLASARTSSFIFLSISRYTPTIHF